MLKTSIDIVGKVNST